MCELARSSLTAPNRAESGLLADSSLLLDNPPKVRPGSAEQIRRQKNEATAGTVTGQLTLRIIFSIKSYS